MDKIAIYGGSFDPPHNGHKLLAQNLAAECGADKVIIIPAAVSPFKERTGASAEDRLNMCRLLFSEPLFEVEDIEINRGGKSYTVDTVAEIKRKYPDSQLFLFMGDDMFLSFNRWYKYKEIAEMCTIVAACRTEKLEKLNELKAFSEELELKNGSIICGSVPLEISSTVIRSNLKKGIGENLADDVYEYIKARGLYSE